MHSIYVKIHIILIMKKPIYGNQQNILWDKIQRHTGNFCPNQDHAAQELLLQEKPLWLDR